MHDAALCERIRQLEDKVRRLESRDHHCGHWYCNHWHYSTPQWTWTDTGTNTIITGTNTVTGTWQS